VGGSDVSVSVAIAALDQEEEDFDLFLSVVACSIVRRDELEERMGWKRGRS